MKQQTTNKQQTEINRINNQNSNQTAEDSEHETININIKFKKKTKNRPELPVLFVSKTDARSPFLRLVKLYVLQVRVIMGVSEVPTALRGNNIL